MDGFVPFTPFDLLALLPTSPNKVSPRTGKGARRTKRSSPKEDTYLPLVVKDHLYFHVLVQLAGRDVLVPVLADRLPKESASIADSFCQTFGDVWSGLPEPDRQRLLGYWRKRPPVPSYDLAALQQRWPAIRLIDAGSCSSAQLRIKTAGYELNFPATLVAEQPASLSFTIVRVVAVVYRYATGEHWGLVIEMVEQPMDRWERRRKGNFTDEEAELKHATLERQFIRRHEEAIAEVLSRWGYATQESPLWRRGSTKRGVKKV